MLILTGQRTPRDDIASEEVALSIHIHAALALVTAEHCPGVRTSVARILVNASTFSVLFSSELFYFYSGAASLVSTLPLKQCRPPYLDNRFLISKQRRKQETNFQSKTQTN